MLKINEKDRILIVSPHPDDETIGCGGVIAKYSKQVDVLIVTDGRKGHGKNMSDEECASIRKEEACNVLKGVHQVFFLNIPDTRIKDNEKVLKSFNYADYDVIFIPNRNERHFDHLATYNIVRKTLNKQKYKKRILEYEVWTPILVTNRIMDISDVIEIKKEMMSKYASQLTEYDYVDICESLSRFRGAINSVKYAEVFNEIDNRCKKYGFIDFLKKVYNNLINKRKGKNK